MNPHHLWSNNTGTVILFQIYCSDIHYGNSMYYSQLCGESCSQWIMWNSNGNGMNIQMLTRGTMCNKGSHLFRWREEKRREGRREGKRRGEKGGEEEKEKRGEEKRSEEDGEERRNMKIREEKKEKEKRGEKWKWERRGRTREKREEKEPHPKRFNMSI